MRRALYLSALFTFASMLLPAVPAAYGQTRTWTQTAAGTYDWNVAGNWGGTIPNSNLETANINVDIVGNITINLNQVITVRQLNLGDTATSPFNVVIAGNGGSLILDNSSGSGDINSRNGNNIISASITLADATSINHTTAAGSLTIAGDITVGVNQLSIGGAGPIAVDGVVGNGSGGLTKTNAGLVTLSAANTYGGATNINNGILRLTGGNDRLPTGTTVTFGNNGNSGILDLNGNSQTLAGLLTTGTGTANKLINSDLAAAATLTLNIAGTDTFGGFLGDTGANNFGLTKTGVGTLTLTAANTYAGGTVISAGTVAFSNLNNLGTGGITFDGGALQWAGANTTDISARTVTLAAGGGTLDIGANDITLAGAIGNGGAGGLTKLGAGTLTLGGTVTYAGATNIQAGTLRLSGAADRLPTGTTVTLGGGSVSGVLDLNGNSQTLAGLTILGAGTANQVFNSDLAAAATLTLNVAGSNTFDGILGGTGANNFGLTKIGAGTLTLTGSNTYSGGTNINAGTLTFSAMNNLGSGGITFNGGTLRWASGNTADISSRTVTLGAGGATFDSNGNDVTLAGAIGNNGAGGLTKTGAGTLILGGANTYTGATVINGGVLQVADFNPAGVSGPLGMSGAASGNLVFNGGTLRLAGPSTFATNRGATFNAGGATIDLPNAAASLNWAAGTLTGTGGVTWTGANGVVISVQGSHSYTGATTIGPGVRLIAFSLANGGIASSIGASSSAATNLVFNGGTLQFDGSGGPFFNRSATLNSAGGTLAINGDLNISGNLVGAGGLTMAGFGLLTLSGSNTYAGGTTIQSGTLRIGNGGSTGSVTGDITNNFRLVFNRSSIYAFAGIVSGTGFLENDAGQLTLSGMNTYTGRTTLKGGVLSVDTLANGLTASNIGASSNDAGNLVFDGGSLQYTGGTTSIDRGATFNSGGTIDVSNAGTTLTVTGALIGTAGLTKIGAGFLTLTGSNTYDGATAINAGVLSVGVLANGLTASGIGDSSNAAANLQFGGGTLQYTGGTVSIDRSATLNAGGGTIDVSNAAAVLSVTGTIGGTGGLTKVGPGTLALTGAHTYDGVTNINAGVLSVDALANGGTASGIGDSSNAATNLVFGGGALRYTGGSVTIDRAATLNAGGGTIDVSTAATNLTVTGALGGAGGLTKIGAGTLTLSGANTYSGGTTITAGTLQIGAGGTTGSVSGNIVDNAQLVFNRSNSITFAGNITGSGALTKLGGGTLTLSGANDYLGGTTINAGAIAFSAPGNLGTGGITLDGGTLQWTAVADISSRTITLGAGGGTLNTGAAATIAGPTGAGGLTKTGTATLTLAGAASYSGATNVQLGTLQLSGGNDRLPIGTTVILGGGTNSGVLSLNGFSQTLAGLTTSGTGAANRVTNSSATAATLTLDIAGSDTFAGILGNTSANNFGLTKAGAGTLTLSNANTYTGATLIQSGTLALSGADRLSASTAATINAGAALTTTGTQTLAGFSGAGSATVGGNLTVGIASGSDVFSGTIDGAGGLIKTGVGTLTLAGAASQTGGTTVSAGTLQIGNGGAAGSLAGNVTDNGVLAFNRSDDFAFAGVIGGAGAVTQLGGGKLTLNGANTYDGATTINAGVLSVSVLANGLTTSGIGDSSNAAANLQFGGGALQYTGGSVTIDRGATLNAGGGAVDVFNAGTNLTVTGTLTGAGALTKAGAGTLTLSNAGNNYSGGTNINAGMISFAALGNLGTGGIAFGGGTLQWAAGNTTDISARTVTFAAGGATLDTNGNNVALAGAIGNAGAGGLTKIGAGTLTLNAVNTYTGDTNINAGLVTLGHASALQSSTVSINLNDGLNLNGLPAVTLGGLAGSGNLNLGSTALTVGGNGASTVYSGALSGSGSLTKVGAGTLTLAGSAGNGAAVTAGTLQIGNGGTTGTLAGNVSVSTGATLAFNRSDDLGFAGTVSGAGSLTKSGAGTLTLSGFNTYSGATNVNAGALLLNLNSLSTTGGIITVGSSAGLTASGFVPRAVAGAGTVTAAGNLFIGDFNSTSGYAAAGTLTIGANTVQLLDADKAQLGAATNISAGGRLVTINGALLGGGLDGVTVDPTKLLTLTGGTGTVQGAFTNNGQINVQAGGQLVFADLVKGGGSTTGTVVYNGGYSPGNSPASVFAGDVILGSFNTLTMELGGTTQGSQYDHITVAGTLSANGALNVTAINGFTSFAAGQSFDLFDGTTTGTFSSVALPTLSAGLTWDTSQLYSAGIISVITPVPEPAAILAAAIAGLLAWRQLRRAAASPVRRAAA